MTALLIRILLSLPILAAGYVRLRRPRDDAAQRAFTVAIVCAGVLSIFSAFLPFVATVLHWEAVPAVFGLGYVWFSVVCFVKLTEALQFMMLSPMRSRALARRPRVVGFSFAVLISLAVGAGRWNEIVSPTPWPFDHYNWLVLTWSLWLLTLVVFALWIGVLATWAAITVEQSRLRFSMVLLIMVCVLMLFYVQVMLTLRSTVIGSLGVGSIPIAFTICLWALYVVLAVACLWVVFTNLPAVNRRRDTRQLDSIRPLWHRLAPIDPGVVLDPMPDSCPIDREDRRHALYRSAVEIRDWMLQLRRALPYDAWGRALEGAAPFARTKYKREVIAAAGWIEAAMAAVTESDEPDRFSPTPPSQPDVDSELATLARISQVSPEVARAVAATIRQTTPQADAHSQSSPQSH